MAKQPIPKENIRTGRLRASDIMIYYKLDDNDYFQTFIVDGYGEATQIPSLVVGRFTGQEMSSGQQYEIQKIEAKAFSLNTLNATYRVPDLGYRVINISLDKNSTLDDVYVIVDLESTVNNNRSNRNVDYIYGDPSHLGEPPIMVNKEADITFVLRKDGRPILGGYECNGKASF